jgi:hypothetical protein
VQPTDACLEPSQRRTRTFSPTDAKLRAELTFAAGIGLLHLAGSAEQAQSVAQRERFLDLMLAEVLDSS